MQSRLAAAAAAAVKFNRCLLPVAGEQFPAQWLGFATSTGRTADPAEHAVEHEDVYPDDAMEDEKLRHRPEYEPTSKDNQSYVPPKSPKQSAPKLEFPAAGPQTDPLFQQRRRNSNSVNSAAVKLEDVTCAGLDGSPWPEEENESDRRTQREEQERDDKEYFKDHKASPLSEIEVADTRKPVTRATDGGGGGGGGGGSGVRVWRPEQLLSAEETLRLAVEMFRRNAVRGDPDSPHGRVLRQLRREYW